MGSSVWTISSRSDARMLEMNPVRELDAGNPHVQFDEREVETEPPMREPRHLSTLPERGGLRQVCTGSWHFAGIWRGVAVGRMW